MKKTLSFQNELQYKKKYFSNHSFSKLKVMIAGSIFLIFTMTSIILAESKIDNALYKEMLFKHVKNGLVNYNGFKTDEKKLDQYLKHLESINPENLNRNDQFAFYINAYNSWTIKLILTGYPDVTSIKELKEGLFGSPWKRKICRINGKLLTLDEIEHDILRPRFKDPRVHFAINCASISCPKLMDEPFEGTKIDEQLLKMTQSFINNSEKNFLKGKTLYVSKIFSWFSKDFNDDIISFFKKYAGSELKAKLEDKKGSIKIKYLKYDWALNDQ